jgi:RHS repeat-associated protein
MGRVFAHWQEDGSWTRTERRPGAGEHCPEQTRHHSITVGGGKPEEHTCYDALGREVRSARVGFGGRFIHVDTYRDIAGRVTRVSEPHYAGDAVDWNLSFYDVLGRIARVDSASGNDVINRYGQDVGGRCGVDDPLALDTVDGAGRRRMELRNVLGEITTVYDHRCGMITNEHDAVGNLIRTTGADGVSVTMQYDLRGRKISMSDPDKGHWRYAWNALGERLRQLDPKGQAMDFGYDQLGRITDRWELVDAVGMVRGQGRVLHHERTLWQNATDPSAPGKGKRLSVIYQMASGHEVHRIDHQFDELGRLAETADSRDSMQFVERTTYDQFGRVFQRFDASGDFRGIRYVYNADGYLEILRESREGLLGRVYQQILDLDARGNITAMKVGDALESHADFNRASGQLERLAAYDAHGIEIQHVSYLWDVVGNMVQRHDRSGGRDLREDFERDDLGRLLRVELTAPQTGSESPRETLALRYGPSGNIAWKSDVGAYTYGEGSGGPHAVTSAGTDVYSYDENGNQVSGRGRAISYSLFDKPVLVETAAGSTRFAYGIGNQRILRQDENEVDGRKTTHYLNGVELIEEADSVRYRRYLGGVVISDWFPATALDRTHYVIKDHRGSVHAMVGESGEAGSAIWMNFDAFGSRQGLDWTSPPGTTDLVDLLALTTRGFGGHEHVDSAAIVHMNGRAYDPRLGRFLQADPYVQTPADTQGLNRYSYALNGPLGLTDPSGYFLKRFVKRWGRLAAAIALSVILPGAQGLLATHFGLTNAYLQAAVTGFAAGAISSGSLKGAVIGAITAVAVAGIVQAHSGSPPSQALASPDRLQPSEAALEHLYGPNGPPQGLYRIDVGPAGVFEKHTAISAADIVDGDVIFTNGMNNGFGRAIRNGSSHLHQSGLLADSYVLNFNPTRGFFADLLEASTDIVGAHTGWTHSSLAGRLAQTLHRVSENGVRGIHVVGHSQGGAITVSALRLAGRGGLNLASIAGGGVSLHGAPVNAWLARSALGGGHGVSVVSRAQFGDAVHVLGGLNVSNPLEIPVALFRLPALLSPDPGLSPHSLPCGGTSRICAP